MKPARKIKNYKGRASLIGKFSSTKMRCMIHWESTIERDYIYLLEIDSSVTSYSSQPLKLEYWHEGKKHKYTPDFLVMRDKRIQIVEIKDAKRIAPLTEFFQAIKFACEDKGWEFIVVTDTQIRVQPILNNARLLCRYSNDQITFEFLDKCDAYFAEHPITTLGSLKRYLKSYRLPLSQIYTLMYRSYIGFDITHVFNDQLILTRKEDEIWPQLSSFDREQNLPIEGSYMKLSNS